MSLESPLPFKDEVILCCVVRMTLVVKNQSLWRFLRALKFGRQAQALRSRVLGVTGRRPHDPFGHYLSLSSLSAAGL